jgi:hypothetical protein
MTTWRRVEEPGSEARPPPGSRPSGHQQGHSEHRVRDGRLANDPVDHAVRITLNLRTRPPHDDEAALFDP